MQWTQSLICTFSDESFKLTHLKPLSHKNQVINLLFTLLDQIASYKNTSFKWVKLFVLHPAFSYNTHDHTYYTLSQLLMLKRKWSVKNIDRNLKHFSGTFLLMIVQCYNFERTEPTSVKQRHYSISRFHGVHIVPNANQSICVPQYYNKHNFKLISNLSLSYCMYSLLH